MMLVVLVASGGKLVWAEIEADMYIFLPIRATD